MHCRGVLSQHAMGRGCLQREGVVSAQEGLPGKVSAQRCVSRGVYTPTQRQILPWTQSRHPPDSEVDTSQNQRQTPPPDMTIEVGGTHHTRMHSCVLAVADLRGVRGTRAPLGGPNSFNFMQFLGKFGKFVCWRHPPRGSWRPLLGEILDPPLIRLISLEGLAEFN